MKNAFTPLVKKFDQKKKAEFYNPDGILKAFTLTQS